MRRPYEFHEVWWIASPGQEEWAGLRIAHFRKSMGDELLVIITGETDQRRYGVRVWDDVAEREGWRKVARIEFPTPEQITAALGLTSTQEHHHG